MIDIILISPNLQIAESAIEAKKIYGLDLTIKCGLMEEAVGIAREIINSDNKIKIFISRGGTALKLSEIEGINLVEIKITVEDIFDALSKAKKIGNRILLIGFKNHIQGFHNLSNLVDLDIKQEIIYNEDDAYEKILKARLEGYEVVVGGEVQCGIAKMLGIPYVLLETSPSSFYIAYQEALRIRNVIINQKRKLEEFRVILDNTDDAYIAFDMNSNVTLINEACCEFLNVNQDIIGINIDKIKIKGFEFKNILDQISKDTYELFEINGKTVLASKQDLKLNYDDIGYMIIFKDIVNIRAEESKVRLKQNNRWLSAKYNFDKIIGKSKALQETKKIAKLYAKHESPILIFGESGTGKEMFAQSIHQNSKLKNGPFVAINCASLSTSILESELFGYVEGAFTGAKKTGKPGVFEMAQDGTLFLDEISEIPLDVQGKLLRVIQEKQIMRLGDDKIMPVNARIIAATNKNLIEEINNGRFRKDLYFRINVLRLNIPPLRNRKEDIEDLVKFFITKYGYNSVLISQNALDLMENYDWPGNVRELDNLVERLCVISNDNKISDSDILNYFSEVRNLEGIKELSNFNNNLTKDKIIETINFFNGNKSKAAEYLGVHRSTIWRYLNK
ncbi:Proprionate catabolism activator, Fis family [Tepidanaerobacter acetatoxydans Re1]|uniref:Proprionate catabolism activator, Fis family n=1 Tax=Tepidanaerobacter acetatoxydans (strain DSM 21804 / JCM 16047 / Re1) TaxID=1209989 RepID=L0RYG5_TEPAE|nr:sigma 54-interacting transcriptional regulator [Tepidanaerobacter acetatoxydans]CCP25254.1 Proprionate catabolism activator, Fis family [Tepidanaerobacter acetatoxydans Re1]